MKTVQQPTFIFDLDGVITKTEAYHFEAWKETACLFRVSNYIHRITKRLKGVSRVDSLKKNFDNGRERKFPVKHLTACLKKRMNAISIHFHRSQKKILWRVFINLCLKQKKTTIP